MGILCGVGGCKWIFENGIFTCIFESHFLLDTSGLLKKEDSLVYLRAFCGEMQVNCKKMNIHLYICVSFSVRCKWNVKK